MASSLSRISPIIEISRRLRTFRPNNLLTPANAGSDANTLNCAAAQGSFYQTLSGASFARPLLPSLSRKNAAPINFAERHLHPTDTTGRDKELVKGNAKLYMHSLPLKLYETSKIPFKRIENGSLL